MNTKLRNTLFGTFVMGAEEMGRRMLRAKGQTDLQGKVDASAPKPEHRDLTVSKENVQLTIIDNTNVDLANFQESPMTDHEVQEWKALISQLGGETLKTGLNAIAFNELVRCDVPLKDLCRIKDNPEAMRGMVIKDGRISKQASFAEAGLANVAPLLVIQCMAALTSQYFQQVITERLNEINHKIDCIFEILTADDKSKLKVSYNRFVDLSKKTSYDIADKYIVSEFSGYVEMVREKYRYLLDSISGLNVDYQWSDKKEAEQKIRKLQNSHYFEYLDMAMQAEVLNFIASAISMKIAKSLGNEEDVTIYAGKMNLDYWNNYVDQFNRIKHDVIMYLELEADASFIQGKSINAMKDEQLKKFNSVEESMLKLQMQFEYKTVLYISPQEDGSLKKYISIYKSNS